MSDDFTSQMLQKEYAHQLFGRSKFLDVNQIRDLWKNLLEYSLESLSKKLVQKYDSNSVQQSMNDLRTMYMNSFDQHSPELEALLREFINIPDTVLLPEDVDHENPVTEEDERALDLEIRRQEAKLASLNSVDKELKTLLKNMASLRNVAPILDENTLEAKRISELTSDVHKEMESELLPIVHALEKFFGNLNLEQ